METTPYRDKAFFIFNAMIAVFLEILRSASMKRMLRMTH